MSFIPLTPDPARDLIRRLLDKGYAEATRAVVRGIVGGSTSGILAQRLDDLDMEAARLAEAGLPMTASNPVARALLADLEGVMPTNAALINGTAGELEQGAFNAAGQVVRQSALPGFTDAQLAQIGVQWNTPDPNAIRAALDRVETQAFADLLAQYTEGTLQQVQGVMINGIAAGRGPLAIARDLRRAVQGLPAHNANQIMRTLQLTSFRDAQRVHRVANSHIIEYQIRIAALDDSICMACVALHGTVMPLGERVDDHHQGRCTSITKVRGFAAPEIESGEDWFRRQPDSVQRAMMGNKAWDQWKSGRIGLAEFVGPYNDPVFGRMLGTRSLKQIQAGIGRMEDFVGARPDYLTEAVSVVPGMISTGLDSDVAFVMSDFLGYTPDGDPMWSAEAVRMGAVDLFVDVRQIGRVDPSIAQVDLIRLRASGILATDAQLPTSQFTTAELNSLKRLTSTDFGTANAEITKIRDLRLKGAGRGRVGGFQGDDFVSAQAADNIARLLEMNQ